MKIRVNNGYAMLYRPEHPSAYQTDNWKGYVFEHRFVMERLLGRLLREDEHVHHLDCNKQNNDPSNLIVLSMADHAKLHKWIERGSPINETGEVPRCAICEAALYLQDQKRTCSVECKNELRRREAKVTDRPSYEQLKEDIETMSMVKVGKKYGVSDNAVRKWLKTYEKMIQVPVIAG